MTDLPPYADLLKLRIEEREDGPLFVMPFHEDVVGRPGFLHGGAIAGLLEFAAFTTLKRALGDREAQMKPITVTVDYMRGGTSAGDLRRCRGRAARRADRQCRGATPGRRTAPSRSPRRVSISCWCGPD